MGSLPREIGRSVALAEIPGVELHSTEKTESRSCSFARVEQASIRVKPGTGPATETTCRNQSEKVCWMGASPPPVGGVSRRPPGVAVDEIVDGGTHDDDDSQSWNPEDVHGHGRDGRAERIEDADMQPVNRVVQGEEGEGGERQLHAWLKVFVDGDEAVGRQLEDEKAVLALGGRRQVEQAVTVAQQAFDEDTRKGHERELEKLFLAAHVLGAIVRLSCGGQGRVAAENALGHPVDQLGHQCLDERREGHTRHKPGWSDPFLHAVPEDAGAGQTAENGENEDSLGNVVENGREGCGEVKCRLRDLRQQPKHQSKSQLELHGRTERLLSGEAPSVVDLKDLEVVGVGRDRLHAPRDRYGSRKVFAAGAERLVEVRGPGEEEQEAARGDCRRNRIGGTATEGHGGECNKNFGWAARRERKINPKTKWRGKEVVIVLDVI
ncbi:hypothetical protein IWX48DRAFT_175124 [Phyllosticta citricarpa]